MTTRLLDITGIAPTGIGTILGIMTATIILVLPATTMETADSDTGARSAERTKDRRRDPISPVERWRLVSTGC